MSEFVWIQNSPVLATGDKDNKIIKIRSDADKDRYKKQVRIAYIFCTVIEYTQIALHHLL